jgi:hypothetical protein
MTCDVITLDAFDTAALPAASQAQVVGAFPADVRIAQVIVKRVGRRSVIVAPMPFALDLIVVHLRDSQTGLELQAGGDRHGRVVNHLGSERFDRGCGSGP